MSKYDTRILIVAPTGRDAALMSETLRRFDIAAEACPTVLAACEAASHGVGAMVLAEEALDPNAIEQIAHFFKAQPKWSSIPLVLLTSNGDRIYAGGQALLQQSGLRGNLILLERPIRRLTLRTAIESAIQTRTRQYELRDYMEELLLQQERLRQSQKMESIGILAGGIAHDFNNLLTGVLGNASLILDELPAESPNRALLRQVVQASERAAHLTRQLLAYAGKGRFVIEPLDLSQQVREISALIQTSIPSAVQLRLDLADGLPPIEADASQIQQIIMNLVINGAEAIPEGQPGTVNVTTGVREVDQDYLGTTSLESSIPEGTYVMLEVRDTGIGMDQETQSRMFDPFFTTKFTGRGLGLAAVMGIVRGHHGALKIDSTPGRGSTFEVLLPATRASVQEARPQPAATLPAGHGTVMVVDDEAIVRQVAKTALERLGYSVVVYEDGPTAIRGFRAIAGDVCAVLLDMSMPVMSGEETFRQLRAIRPDVKVILSSGYNEFEAMSRFAGKGLAGFIQKPYTSARLGETVRSVVQSPELGRPV